MTEKTPMETLMQGVIPYLAVENAEDVIAFYEEAFGAILRGEPARDPNGHILNATLEINGGALMLVDVAAGMGSQSIEPVKTGHSCTMQLISHKGQAMWDRAVSAGCTVEMPFEKQFWGDQYGRLEDPFGIQWAIDQPSPENQAAAQSA